MVWRALLGGSRSFLKPDSSRRTPHAPISQEAATHWANPGLYLAFRLFHGSSIQVNLFKLKSLAMNCSLSLSTSQLALMNIRVSPALGQIEGLVGGDRRTHDHRHDPCSEQKRERRPETDECLPDTAREREKEIRRMCQHSLKFENYTHTWKKAANESKCGSRHSSLSTRHVHCEFRRGI